MVSVGQQSPATLTDIHAKRVEESSEQFTTKYTIGLELGRGRFAKVNQVRSKITNNGLAAKIIRRWRNGKDTLESILRELHIAQLCRGSERMVQIQDYHIGPREVILVFEHATGGDLYHATNGSIVNLPPSFVRSAVFQILHAVSFLHRRSIVHLDVKPENILLRRPLPDCDVVLCDFGLAKFLDNDQPVRDLVGTPDYVAPEILDYNPIHLTTDIWSIGAVTYYLLTGISPFWAPTKEETFDNVCQLRITFPDDLFSEIPQAAIQFIQRLIVKNPCLRPSAYDCLQDPWFQTESNGLTVPDESTDTVAHDTTADHANDTTNTEQPRADLDRSIGEC